MNKSLLFFFFLFGFYRSHAQINALTENGKQVVLYENGTWKYSSDSTAKVRSSLESIKLNTGKFIKTNDQTFVIKSNSVNVGIFIDTKKWTVTPHRDNETNPEYRFSLKAGNAVGAIFTEQTPVPLESMRDIALINFQKAAVDAKIINQEYRMVNGNKVLCLEMSGTIKDIKFKYLNYYLSTTKGVTQLISYAPERFFEVTKGELKLFLNGLVTI